MAALIWWILAESPVSGATARPSSSSAEATSADRKQAGEEFDINELTRRLRETTAIGLFTKLSLRNKVDDLLDAFRRFHAGETDPSLEDLRERFNFLIIKTISLLQDKEPELSRDIYRAHEVLWGKLVDPEEFSKI